MNLVEIPEIDFRAEVPEHWDELSSEQVEFCLKQAVLASLGIVEPVEAQLRCLYHVMDIERDWRTEKWERTQSKELVADKNSQIIILAQQLFAFLFKTNERELLEVNYNTLTNHFPVIDVHKTQLFGPADMLTDLSFGEFRAAITYMNEYFRERTSISLSKFIACLYRPASPDIDLLRMNVAWNGIIREPFNPHRVSENAAYTEKLPTVFRTGILLWFTFCLDFIQKNDIPIDGSEVNFSLIFEGGEGGPGTGWTGVLHAISEKAIFGTADQVDQRNIFDLFMYMYDKELENRKLKRKFQTKGS